MKTPLEVYQQKLSNGEIAEDAQQCKVIDRLEKIYRNLIKRQQFRDSQIGQLRRKIKPRRPIKGLYLYGSVGVGKTFLLDVFYDCLPVPKVRIHFHAFMQQVHQSLKENQGTKNPLQKIARQIADDVLVICFDEFFVSNITDAMILGELFKALFKGGVCLVTTSNIAPDDLYKNGLQRERFLPAIKVIKNNVRSIHLKTTTDYRRRHIEKAGVYFSPLDNNAEKKMETAFELYSAAKSFCTEKIEILGRQIEIIKQADNTIWFDFYKICGRPRSQNDYLELVKHYHTFLVSNVPVLDDVKSDLILSFINLIDILYDAQKRVVISAEAPVTKLYSKDKHKVAFDRTESRLIEMQSDDYFLPKK